MTTPQAQPVDVAETPEPDGSAAVSETCHSTNDKPQDPEEDIIVNWDGDDDPGNPKTWPYAKKWRATLTVSLFTFVSPVSSSMIAPGAAKIGDELGIHSSTLLAMSISVFVLAYAVGPLILGPLSELYGRTKVLQFGNLFFFAWNMGCGFAQTESQLIAFRFFSGLGGSAPLAAGGGSLADMWRPEERGKAIAIYSLAPLLGPVVGPIVGGWIAERTSWRWVFWSTCIFDVFVQILGLFFLRETYAPVLLGRRAQAIRKSMDPEKGNRRVRTVFEKAESRDWKHIFGKAFSRPVALFIHEPIVQVIAVYSAFVYGVFYLFLTTIPTIFKVVYHESIGIAGLHYIALGLGLWIASQINARYMDKIYLYLKEKNNGVGRPEFRVPAMVPGSIIFPVGMLVSGWCADQGVHWIGTDIGLALVGAGAILILQSVQAYVVDTFALYAASALSAVACLRALAGFGFPLFAPAMYNALGYGKGVTVLSVISITIGCPAPFLFWKYGQRIREKSRHSKK